VRHRRRFLLGAATLSALIWVRMHQETRTAEPWPGVKPTRILIVEEQALFASMLAELLRAHSGFTVVASVGTFAAAENALENRKIDLVVVNLTLPDRSGLELIAALGERKHSARIVVCTAVEHPSAVVTAFGLGAHAFVERSSGLPELVATLRRVARGEHCLGPRVAKVLRDHASGREETGILQATDLTVLRRLASREAVRDIAASLNLSASGIYKVRHRIARATGARTKRDFHRAALSLGLVSGDPGSAEVNGQDPADAGENDAGP